MLNWTFRGSDSKGETRTHGKLSRRPFTEVRVDLDSPLLTVKNLKDKSSKSKPWLQPLKAWTLMKTHSEDTRYGFEKEQNWKLTKKEHWAISVKTSRLFWQRRTKEWKQGRVLHSSALWWRIMSACFNMETRPVWDQQFLNVGHPDLLRTWYLRH